MAGDPAPGKPLHLDGRQRLSCIQAGFSVLPCIPQGFGMQPYLAEAQLHPVVMLLDEAGQLSIKGLHMSEVHLQGG